MNKLRSSPFRLLFIAFLFTCFTTHTNAQSSGTPIRVAVLAPLYIDSAFDNTIYKLSNTSIPKYILPGLDFYNGVMMAVDSLKKEGLSLDVWILQLILMMPM
jgi:hypothetical protein